MTRHVRLPEELACTLPPGKYSEECWDADFTCGHWVHNFENRSEYSPAFGAFMDQKVAESKMSG